MARYEGFLSLRARYKGARFVLMSLPEWPYRLLKPSVEQVVQSQRAAGHNDVFQLHYVMQGEALHWHPSSRQHKEIANLLIDLIDRENLTLMHNIQLFGFGVGR